MHLDPGGKIWTGPEHMDARSPGVGIPKLKTVGPSEAPLLLDRTDGSESMNLPFLTRIGPTSTVMPPTLANDGISLKMRFGKGLLTLT